MGISHREKKHAEIEAIIGLGELDRLTDAAYESVMAGISVDAISQLPKDIVIDALIGDAADGLREGYLRHAGYSLRKNRRFFSKWMMVDGEELRLNAIIDRLREADE